MPKINLTQKFVDKPTPPPEGKRRIEHCDINLPGLYLEVRDTSPTGGTYYLRYKSGSGTTRHTKIARSTDISLKDARAKAQQLRADIQRGHDPQEQARQRKAVPTWDAFFNHHYLPHAKQHKRSWKNDEEMNRLRISAFIGGKRLDKITRSEVQRFHVGLVDEGLSPATADHHLKLIRQALNLAVDWTFLKANPVTRVKLFSVDNQQERTMSSEQLRNLMLYLDQDKNRPVCLAIKYLFYTGARVNEALHARWSDIDRKNRVWTIQATNSKSKQRRSVPLSDAAIAVLDELDTAGKSEWLFNSRRGGRMTTIAKVWTRIRREAGLEGTLEGGLSLRLHDARHAAASAMVSSGQSLYTVQKILGHSDPSVTQRYAHLSTESLQEAANSIGRFVEDAIENTGE